ncbi:MAG: hypothetical protein KF780_04525 [Sphingomonas sp.]|nr:hypothetical protein [Sphingomonas sp.]
MAAGRHICQGGGMTKTDGDRAKRLAAALRENLKRRKAQARATPSDVSAPIGNAPENQDSKRRP